MKNSSLQHKERIQPNLNWALVIVRNGFVADVSSQNLEINNLNTNTNNDKYPIAVFVCWCSNFEVFVAESWFRCPSQNAEIHQGRRGHHDDSPNLVGLCKDRAGNGASRISSWNKLVWSQNRINNTFQLTQTNHEIHIINLCTNNSCFEADS